jgi:hypothetical protein
LAEDGTATVDIRSTIIGQSDVQLQAREFLTVPSDNGQLVVTGASNLIRSQGDYQAITVSTDDPLLEPLANNGGPTLTHALPNNSPAINLGSNPQSLATDQRGVSYSRAIGGTADIGAFELQTVIGPELPGDYNGNQIVDGADYLLWRKTRGAEVPQFSGADGSGNSLVDDADYTVWREHFGETPPSASAAVVSGDTESLTPTAAAARFTLVDSSSDSPQALALASLASMHDAHSTLVAMHSRLGTSFDRSRSGRTAPPTSNQAHDQALLSVVSNGSGYASRALTEPLDNQPILEVECSRHAPRAVASQEIRGVFARAVTAL